jgi:hypothetical protein
MLYNACNLPMFSKTLLINCLPYLKVGTVACTGYYYFNEINNIDSMMCSCLPWAQEEVKNDGELKYMKPEIINKYASGRMELKKAYRRKYFNFKMISQELPIDDELNIIRQQVATVNPDNFGIFNDTEYKPLNIKIAYKQQKRSSKGYCEGN